MNILCVDDEPLVLKLVVSMCEKLPLAPDVTGFTRAREALDWLAENKADIALLDIDMPGTDGLALAREVKLASPDTAIIFLTGYDRYAVDAFELHVSGYLLKPVNCERLEAEIEYALSGKGERNAATLAEAHTFGNFDLCVNGKPVAFSRSKAKELLAYLVDRRGSTVTRSEMFTALWEKSIYDRAAQKELDVVIRTMRNTLDEHGVGEIVEMGRGTLRVVPELVSCDMYRFFDGDERAVTAFRGDYMASYSWARRTERYMERAKRES